ncbi:ABC transporter substrate-binding protein [Frondihabitans cladoniiphilus]|uniref:ABC transporter substrate-binding protein n=2 Tax=Frondihabitans cladoniiphilus TaxID=715785 RepID=A0ABP8W4G2_9MICO
MLTVAQPADLTSDDPVIDNGLYSLNVFHAVFDQLTQISPAGAIEPKLATKYVSSNGGKTWTFTIQKDAKFSDGTDETADDVAYSFQAVQANPKSLNQIYTKNIASVKAVDKTTVQFDLTNADANFPRIAYYISVVPQALYSKEGTDGFVKAPIGAGPYTLVKWTPGTSVVLKANDSYWGGAPKIKNVTVVPVADTDSRLNSLLSGSADLAALAPSQLSQAQASTTSTVKQAQSNQDVYLGYNTSATWLSDPNFREAVSLAVDRKTIISTVLNGLGTIGTASSVAPNVNGYDSSLSAMKFDLKKAKALVKASGYDGTAIPFQYATNGGIAQSDELAQSIEAELKAAGINVTLQGSDTASFNLSWSSKSLKGLYLQQFSPSMMDAATTLNYLYGPTGEALFSDPDINSLITEASGTTDPTARKAVIAKIWGINADKTYLSNLYYTKAIYGVANDLNWTPRADGMLDFVHASYK